MEPETEADQGRPDQELVDLARAGDMRAFDELVTRYRGKVYAMIYHMVRNEQDAWEISQEAFVRAWKSLPRFKARSSFYTWLYRIASNSAIDWLRRQKPQSAGEFDDENIALTPMVGQDVSPQAEPSPEENIHRRDIIRRIEKALDQLSEEHRTVILLKEVEGLAYKEIAEVVGCSIGTVMSRLFHARKKMQTLLKDFYEKAR